MSAVQIKIGSTNPPVVKHSLDVKQPGTA
jgi:hypothetical protein